MTYHIDNILIFDSFASDSECPICLIRSEIENKLVDQFLNEAVMIDEFREMVNKSGFCIKHSDMLFSGQNKLGVGLQYLTRIRTIQKNLVEIKNSKQAKIVAENISMLTQTCCICEIVNQNLEVYFKGIPKLFHNNPEFKDIFSSCKGFCLSDYANLLKYSSHAKGSEKEFINTICKIQDKSITRLYEELSWFCDKFDYRNASKPFGTSKDALIRVIKKLR